MKDKIEEVWDPEKNYLMGLYENSELKLRQRYADGDAKERRTILEIMDGLGNDEMSISEAVRKVLLGAQTSFSGKIARKLRRNAGYGNGKDMVRKMFPEKDNIGNEYSEIMKFEREASYPSNPPRGVAKVYLNWLKDNIGYNPLDL